MTARLLEQKRAEAALQKIEKLTGKAKDFRDAYTSYAKSLPATILLSGLGQAVAMAMSKAAAGEGSGGNREAWKKLVMHLEAWLLNEAGEASPYYDGGFRSNGTPGLELMKKITGLDQRAYVTAQAEALAYLQWLKKFANALLAEPEKAAETADASEAG
ncbi:MAG TPA: type III-B CRISPR module-associated protein Cmr5 [Rhodospirillales bacterium]|nr:type III-B CRISPR module-associated protein Cmr5 [Rhodospirillales bacterium]